MEEATLPSNGEHTVLLVCLALISSLLDPGRVAADTVPVTLSGSPASMERQHRVARDAGLRFYRTPREVRRALERGELVRPTSSRVLRVKEAREGAARPEVKHFLEALAAAYHARCGEPLVATSLTRASTRQPSNAHPLSVHPAGMAIDLRIPRRAACSRWLERELLRLERLSVVDVTREHRPAHLHVAVFPSRYLAYVEMMAPAPHPQVVPGARLASEEALVRVRGASLAR